jgi:CheY-like chemotaxis protein
VTVSSIEGRGSVFGIRLPIVEPRKLQAAGERPAIGAEISGARILVVDDDRAAREAMAGMLAQWRCRVDQAGGRDAALAIARASPPDLVICDLHLDASPSGWELVEALRQAHPGPLPAVIVTADVSDDTLREARARGLPLLRKPASPAGVRAVIEQLLRTPED